MTILASVGRDGRNNPADVLTVQQLLTQRGEHLGVPDGICGQRTIGAIEHFQAGFLRRPDGLVEPNGITWRNLTGTVRQPTTPAAAASVGRGWTELLPRPAKGTFNSGLTAVSNRYMTEVFGAPRSEYSSECQALTNTRLSRAIVIESVGPFRVQGLRPAVASLRTVMGEIETTYPDLFSLIGTAGMLCARYVRGSTTSISNHSWGTAIDLTIAGRLDPRGDNRVQRGLQTIAPIFNRHGWYWGAMFPTEDAMHFEAGRDLVETWRSMI